MLDVFLLLAGVAWLYFWLKGNWFAGIIGLPISAYVFLTLRAWSVPPGAPFSTWHWVGLLCAAAVASLPFMIKQGLDEDRARKNIRGITLNKRADANFNG